MLTLSAKIDTSVLRLAGSPDRWAALRGRGDSVPPSQCRIKRDTPQVEPLRLTSEPIPHHTRDVFGR